ncbi:MAG: hypothetical protein AB7G25_10125 [Sphingomonadaceae bacterium]
MAKQKKQSHQKTSWWTDNRKPVALIASAAAIAAGAVFTRMFQRGKAAAGEDEQSGNPGGHVPTDLMTGEHPGPDDAPIEAFRPDMTAPIAPEEREAFRPATVPVQ